jgi:hypothetical protein
MQCIAAAGTPAADVFGMVAQRIIAGAAAGWLGRSPSQCG